MTTASFISVDITPDRPERLCGFAIPGRVSQAVETRLEANLACYDCDDGEPMVLGSLDTLFIGSDIAAAIARRAGLAPERLMLIASHTHSAPSLSNDLADSIGGPNARYAAEVIERVGAAVASMLGSRRPIHGIGAGRRATNLHVNRRRRAWMLDLERIKAGRGISISHGTASKENDAGFVDPYVRALVFRLETGGPAAVVWSFTAHASRSPWVDRISADFPGVVRDRLRRTFGDALTVLFMPGFAGSTVPRAPFQWPRTLRQLARSSLPLMPRCQGFTPATFAAWTTQLSGVVLDAVYAATAATTNHGPPRFGGIVTDAVFVRDGGDRSRDLSLDIRRIAFGPKAAIVAMNGEPLAEWLPLLRDTLPDAVIPTGYHAGQPLYIPPASVIAEGGYEVEGFKPYFRLEGSFPPDIDQRVTAALASLMAETAARG